jgi:Mce-associated membrane protein
MVRRGNPKRRQSSRWRAASDSTVAILSYKPETVDQDLKAAADRLAEPFRQQYTQLVKDVVAPGAQQQHISAVATVPSAASVSATGKHAVVLVFADQTTTIGNDAPTQSTSSVRVGLDKVGGRWLVSQFDPV